MTFPILGANSAVGGYAIDNSLRFNDGDSPRLDRTSVSSPTDSKIFTYSVWLKKTSIGSNFTILDARSGTNRSQILFRSGSNEAIRIVETSNNFSSFDTLITTNALYRDVSAWYHVLIKYDSTNGTANNRFLIYVNGVEQSLDINTSVTLNYTTPLNEGNYTNDLGHADGAEPFDGYIAEAHFIDGQALSPTDFGEFDEDSGIWKPIRYSGSYGTNGFYLDFENSGSLGADSSPNGNNFTPTNLASTDQTTDTPTNNFPTWNPLDKSLSVPPTLSEGNTKLSQPASGLSSNTTLGVSSGQWYFECKVTGVSAWLGVLPQNLHPASSNLFPASNTAAVYGSIPNLYLNGSLQGSLGGGVSNGDILMIAFDIDNGNFYVGKNGLWNDGLGGGFDQADFSNATAHSFTVKTGDNYVVGTVNGSGSTSYVLDINFGNPSFSISSGNSDQKGYGNFEYAPPTGFLSLCTQNLATELSPTIDDGSEYFNTVLYTGTGSSTSITGVGFQPDLVYTTSRSNSYNNGMFDSSRGANKLLNTNTTNAEASIGNGISSFDSDGFSFSGDAYNTSAYTFVAWNWKANAGSTSSNTDGSITSTVQANTTSGFSIVTYTGNATAGATVGHGLGKKPDMIIAKNRNTTSPSRDWLILHKSYEGTSAENMRFTTMAVASAGSQASSGWYRTAPSSSVFYLGNGSSGDYSGDTNISGGNMVAYCFAEIEGYSKFGKYTGNITSGTDGAFVYTGFRPSWIMVKCSSTAGQEWVIFDSKRDSFNVATKWLYPNASTAENGTADQRDVDFLSNGFKFRNAGGPTSYSGRTYIYACFSANPFVSSTGIPVTAR